MDICKARTIIKISIIVLIIITSILVLYKNISIDLNIYSLIMLFLNIIAIAWFASPYIVVYRASDKMQNTMKDAIFSWVRFIIIASVGMYLIVDIKYFSSDAQSGIALVFVPAIQFVIYYILLLLINLY